MTTVAFVLAAIPGRYVGTLGHAARRVPQVVSSARGGAMIFRHCWECMVEVTPSGRRIVLRGGQEIVLAPMDAAEMEAHCKIVRRRLGLAV